MAFERFEKRLGDLVLDSGWEFLVEVELLDDQVEIVDESVLDELLDRVIELVRNRLFRVTLFKSQEPEIKLFHSSIDQTFERLVT